MSLLHLNLIYFNFVLNTACMYVYYIVCLLYVYMYVCMYVYYIDSPKGCKFFWKFLSFFTHYSYTLYVPRYQPLSTGSGSIPGAGASRTLPRISIGRTAIVVVHTLYIWSYVSVLLYRWDFGLGNRTRDMLPVFWSSHQGAGLFLLDLQF